MTDLSFTIEHLNMLFEKSSDFVFYVKKVNDDYYYEYINEAAKRNIPNIITGKTVSSVMDLKLAKTIIKNYDQALLTKEQMQFQDYTMFTSEIKKYETTAYPIFTPQGQYILGITKLIAFDRNVEDKYLFMRSVFFKTFLSTVLISKNFELLEANPAFLKGFGISMDNVRGIRLDETDLIAIEHRQKYLQYVQDTIDGRVLSSKPLQFKDLKGNERHFIASFSTLLDEEDEVIAVVIILQETTETIRQKEELKNVSHAMEIMKRALSTAADMSITDTRGRIVDVNDCFVERTGYSREELLGQSHRILNSRFHPPQFFKNLWSTISSGQIWRGEVCNKTKQGVTYWNEATIIPLTDLQGRVFQYLGVYFNVSEKKKMMTELRNIERTFRLITENTSDLIVIFDEQGIISYASPSYIRLLGIDEQTLIGTNYERLLAKNSLSQWQRVLSDEVNDQGVAELEVILASGETVWTECHYNVSKDSRDKTLSETTMVSRIITERKNYENQLKFMAYHDSLTQLPNRRYLEKEFPHLIEMAKVKFQAIAVIYIDGDNFKVVNDRYGHDVGDDFIRNFGKALTRCIHTEDIVVRMGGDEFVIILNGLSRHEEGYCKEIEMFFKKVQQELQVGWKIGGINFNPTATMGVSMYPAHSEQLDELIDLADTMLYDAKSVLRNSFKIYKQ